MAKKQLLKIHNKQGQFLKNGSFVSVSQIEGDDLVELVDAVCENKDVELDSISEDKVISSDVERTIYEHVFNLLNDLHIKRNDYIKEVDEKFSALKEKHLDRDEE